MCQAFIIKEILNMAQGVFGGYYSAISTVNDEINFLKRVTTTYLTKEDVFMDIFLKPALLIVILILPKTILPVLPVRHRTDT